MLDVHPPHQPVHGWRDFLVHLMTITIGLFIALSLEGLVEWQHHRHLVHEAEASLHREIAANAQSMQDTLAQLHKQETDLKHDVLVLNKVIKNPTGKLPNGDHMEIDSHLHTFESVGWKTAQATGALAYMPYDRAQEYADIYNTQDELFTVEAQAARDAILSLAPFMDMSSDDQWTAPQADALKQKIQTLQGQLLLVDGVVKALDEACKKFLAAHPE